MARAEPPAAEGDADSVQLGDRQEVAVSGKAEPSNTVWASNSARQIVSGVFFHDGCVHNYDREAIEKAQVLSLRKCPASGSGLHLAYVPNEAQRCGDADFETSAMDSSV